MTVNFNAIDSGDYATAFAQLAPVEQGTTSVASYGTGLATTYDYGVTVESARRTDGGEYLVDVAFTSLQSSTLVAFPYPVSQPDRSTEVLLFETISPWVRRSSWLSTIRYDEVHGGCRYGVAKGPTPGRPVAD